MVVIDADTDPNSRWQSLRAIALGMGYSADAEPAPAGSVFPPPAGLPSLGIWMMPDNRGSGMLEDFVALMIPAGDRVWNHAQKSTEALPERRFREIDLPKAKIHSWLAWQNDPGMLMGQAINRKALAPESEIARRFMDWIHRLGIEPKPPASFQSPWS